MAEQDFDLNTQETLKRLGFSQTKLTRLVNEGRLTRVPKNPGSHKGKGAGWLYSSQQIDEFLTTKTSDKTTKNKKCCEGDCTKVVSQASTRTRSPISPNFTPKRRWWQIWR